MQVGINGNEKVYVQESKRHDIWWFQFLLSMLAWQVFQFQWFAVSAKDPLKRGSEDGEYGDDPDVLMLLVPKFLLTAGGVLSCAYALFWPGRYSVLIQDWKSY